MMILKWTIRVHKWLAIIVGVQIVIWIAGGFGMALLPIEKVRGEHNRALPEVRALDLAAFKPISELTNLSELSIRQIELTSWLDQPVYRITQRDGHVLLMDARSGHMLSPLSEARVRAVAEADFSGEGEIESLTYFQTDTPWEFRRPGPIWQVAFSDGEQTRLYIDPNTGQVRARRNEMWRWFDTFWMLHIMDYKTRDNFNHPVLIGFAGLALVSALAGFILLILRIQRSLRVQLKAWSKRSTLKGSS